MRKFDVLTFVLFLFQEIFGPVLTVYVYPDNKYKETLELVRIFVILEMLLSNHESTTNKNQRSL